MRRSNVHNARLDSLRFRKFRQLETPIESQLPVLAPPGLDLPSKLGNLNSIEFVAVQASMFAAKSWPELDETPPVETQGLWYNVV